MTSELMLLQVLLTKTSRPEVPTSVSLPPMP